MDSSIVNPENLGFNQGGKVLQHHQIILDIINQTLMKNRGYFTLDQSPLVRTFTFALKALPAFESISDHEEPQACIPKLNKSF